MKRKRQNQKNQNLEDILEILVPFNDYFLKNHDAQAKLALKAFFEQYKDIALDKEIVISGGIHSYYSYFFNVLAVRKALIEKRYANACNAILTVNYCEPLTQKRVYVALMRLYQDYLE